MSSVIDVIFASYLSIYCKCVLYYVYEVPETLKIMLWMEIMLFMTILWAILVTAWATQNVNNRYGRDQLIAWNSGHVLSDSLLESIKWLDQALLEASTCDFEGKRGRRRGRRGGVKARLKRRGLKTSLPAIVLEMCDL